MAIRETCFLILGWLCVGGWVKSAAAAGLLEIEGKMTHGYATNNGVRLHDASLGEGPLVVMLPGFPDRWLSR
jgi:hypothetical protein